MKIMEHAAWNMNNELIQDYNRHYITVSEEKKLPKRGSLCCCI